MPNEGQMLAGQFSAWKPREHGAPVSAHPEVGRPHLMEKLGAPRLSVGSSARVLALGPWPHGWVGTDDRSGTAAPSSS